MVFLCWNGSRISRIKYRESFFTFNVVSSGCILTLISTYFRPSGRDVFARVKSIIVRKRYKGADFNFFLSWIERWPHRGRRLFCRFPDSYRSAKLFLFSFRDIGAHVLVYLFEDTMDHLKFPIIVRRLPPVEKGIFGIFILV